MTDSHSHDYWRTPSGALECACGKSRRPLPEGDAVPAPELTPAERAIVDRFGIHDEDADASEWVVHVLGEDDVLPARDILDAVRQAHAHNQLLVGPGGYYSPERAPVPRPFMPLSWAVPQRREWVA